MVADEARVRRRVGGSRFPSTAIPSAQYEEPQSLAEHSAFQPETGVPVILQLARTSVLQSDPRGSLSALAR